MESPPDIVPLPDEPPLESKPPPISIKPGSPMVLERSANSDSGPLGSPPPMMPQKSHASTVSSAASGILRPRDSDQGPVLLPKQSIIMSQSDDDTDDFGALPEMPELEAAEADYNFTVLYLSTLAILLGRSLILPILVFYANAVNAAAGNKYTAQDVSNGFKVDGQTVREGQGVKLQTWQQTLLACGFYVMYASGGLLWSPLSDRYGRKPIILICLLGMAIGFGGQGLAPNYWVLFGFRTFCGLFAACPGVSQTYLTDVVTTAEVPIYTARLGYVYGAAWASGPILAQCVRWIVQGIRGADTRTDGVNVDSIEFACSFYVAAAMNLAMLVVAYFYLEESLTKINITELPAVELDEATGKPKEITTTEASVGPHAKPPNDGNNEQLISVRSSLSLQTPPFTISSPMLHVGRFSVSSRKPSQEADDKLMLEVSEWQKLQTIIPLLIVILALVQDTAFGVDLAMLPVTLEQTFKWESWKMALLFCAYGTSFASCQFFYVNVESALGPLYTAATAGSIMFLGLAGVTAVIVVKDQFTIYGTAAQMGVILPLQVIFGLGYGMMCTACQSAIGFYSKAEDISFWMGIWICLTCAGCASSVLESLIAKAVGSDNLPYYISLVALVLAVVGFVLAQYYASAKAPDTLQTAEEITKANLEELRMSIHSNRTSLSARSNAYSIFSAALSVASTAQTNLVPPFGVPVMTPSLAPATLDTPSTTYAPLADPKGPVDIDFMLTDANPLNPQFSQTKMLAIRESWKNIEVQKSDTV